MRDEMAATMNNKSIPATRYNFALVFFVALGSFTYGFNASIMGTVFGLAPFFSYFGLNLTGPGADYANSMIGGTKDSSKASRHLLTRVHPSYERPFLRWRYHRLPPYDETRRQIWTKEGYPGNLRYLCCFCHIPGCCCTYCYVACGQVPQWSWVGSERNYAIHVYSPELTLINLIGPA